MSGNKDVVEGSGGMVVDTDRESVEIAINREKQPLFRREVIKRILRSQGLNEYEAIYGISEFHGFSPETARRYLKQMTGPDGMLKFADDEKRGYRHLHFKEAVK